jgi:hypothetical protein
MTLLKVTSQSFVCQAIVRCIRPYWQEILVHLRLVQAAIDRPKKIDNFKTQYVFASYGW